MPQILVMTDVPEKPESEVVYRERVALSDLESDHFSAQLVERMGWAMLDANEREHRPHTEPARQPYEPAHQP